uniref:Uncharacterized protein n=1 Tax=Rhizophora mucronata TaxID=61149 RepID=A0A2P2ND93_RHIMU
MAHPRLKTTLKGNQNLLVV